jgi:hypothetical protein
VSPCSCQSAHRISAGSSRVWASTRTRQRCLTLEV